MNVKMLISRSIGARLGIPNIFSVRLYASEAKAIQKTDSGELEYDEVPIFEKDLTSEEKVNEMRNKSKLNPQDRNKLHGKKPFEQSMEWYHDTVRYKRRTLGRYGLKALDAPAGIAWPTKEEVEDAIDYEQTAYPVSIQEGWKIFEERKRAAAEEIRLREEDIDRKLENMGLWRKELRTKFEKKEATVKAAREKKEKMMEEVRRHFGVNIDPRSPKFKELMEKKEKEDKKKKKDLRKQEHAARLVEKISKMFENPETDATSGKEEKSAKDEKSAKEEKIPKEAKASKELEKEASPEDKKPTESN